MEYLKLSSRIPFEFISGDAWRTANDSAESSATRKHVPHQFHFPSVKRVFDVLGSLLLIAFTLPVMAFVALAVKLSSPGPVIFSQRRLTRGGQEFTMYKFRTMRTDAELASGPVWARESDPRVTVIGSALRRLHLDELPQLFNVLLGEMSLVGPRPERPEMVSWLSSELPGFEKRMEVKAGITGLAQVSHGYASTVCSYRRKLALDILYIKEQCLMLDLRIAARTCLHVLTGR